VHSFLLKVAGLPIREKRSFAALQMGTVSRRSPHPSEHQLARVTAAKSSMMAMGWLTVREKRSTISS
jgi:hypothetical protein